MVNFLPKTSGIGFLFTEPYKYVWLFFFLIFLNLVFSASLANVYSWMVIASVSIWLILSIAKRDRIDLNGQSSNTIQSILLASVFWMAFIGISIFLMGLFQNVFAAQPTFSLFFEANSAAFLGAATPVLAGSAGLSFFVFGFLIPIIETALAIRLVELFMFIFGVKIGPGKLSVLKQPKFWGIAVVMAYLFTLFLIQAKGVGSDSIIPLMMVFIFFFLTAVIAVIPFIGKKREQETATWLHIVNNSAAVGKQLGFF